MAFGCRTVVGLLLNLIAKSYRKLWAAVLNKSGIAAFQLCQSWPPGVVFAFTSTPRSRAFRTNRSLTPCRGRLVRTTETILRGAGLAHVNEECKDVLVASCTRTHAERWSRSSTSVPAPQARRSRVMSSAPLMLPANPYSSGCFSASLIAPYPPIEIPAIPVCSRPLAPEIGLRHHVEGPASSRLPSASGSCALRLYSRNTLFRDHDDQALAPASLTTFERSLISAGLLFAPCRRYRREAVRWYDFWDDDAIPQHRRQCLRMGKRTSVTVTAWSSETQLYGRPLKGRIAAEGGT